jgi:hypothetical protein
MEHDEIVGLLKRPRRLGYTSKQRDSEASSISCSSSTRRSSASARKARAIPRTPPNRKPRIALRRGRGRVFDAPSAG